MIKSELYKIRKHRMPYVLTGLGALAAMAPAVYYMFRAPAESAEYAEAAVAIFGVYGLLAGAVFGGWLLGHEYRQETLRRVVAVDARRGRLLGAKAVAGVAAFVAMSAAMVGAGLGAAAISAASNGDTLTTDGLGQDIAGLSITTLIALGVAYGASAIVRSDTYSTLTSLGLMLVFAPLLALIPNVGDYTLGALANEIQTWVADDIPMTRGVTTTLGATAAWLGATAFAGQQLFARRDI